MTFRIVNSSEILPKLSGLLGAVVLEAVLVCFVFFFLKAKT